MFTNASDIKKGMDVYGSDGEKIGTVADDLSDNTASAGGVSSNDTLGDDTRTIGGRGTGGGPGTLGDETRVYGAPGAGGGRGTLGDETRVSGGYTTGGQETPSGDYGATTGFGGVSTDTDSVPEEVVAEEVPTSAVVDQEIGASGQVSPTTPAVTQAATGYLKVDQGGFLGIGAKELHVPLSAVQNVIPGDRVVLNCTKDEASTMYAQPGQ